MMTKKESRVSSSNATQECFIGELENLLQASDNVAGIPEPPHYNRSEDAGNYMVYLSKLAKKSSKHGHK